MNYKVAARQNGERHKKCHRTDIGQTAQVNTRFSSLVVQRGLVGKCFYTRVEVTPWFVPTSPGWPGPGVMFLSRVLVSLPLRSLVTPTHFGAGTP